MSLKGKRILITAGPTWTAIDPVRVISNTATGETGRRLALALARKGAKITLLLGPGQGACPCSRVTVKRFKFFDELKKLFKDELLRQYDAVIHSAAVSDYRPERMAHTKIKSSCKTWTCRLVRTPKLIAMCKKTARNSFIIGFKYDPRTTYNSLIKSAKSLMCSSELDAVVANTVINGRYKAYIVTQEAVSPPLGSKGELIKKLSSLLCA